MLILVLLKYSAWELGAYSVLEFHEFVCTIKAVGQ